MTSCVRCQDTPRGPVTRPAQPPVLICLGKPLPVGVFRPLEASVRSPALPALNRSSLCRRVLKGVSATAPGGSKSGPVSPPHGPVRVVAGSKRPPRPTRSLAAPNLNNFCFLLVLWASVLRVPLRDRVPAQIDVRVRFSTRAVCSSARCCHFAPRTLPCGPRESHGWIRLGSSCRFLPSASSLDFLVPTYDFRRPRARLQAGNFEMASSAGEDGSW